MSLERVYITQDQKKGIEEGSIDSPSLQGRRAILEKLEAHGVLCVVEDFPVIIHKNEAFYSGEDPDFITESQILCRSIPDINIPGTVALSYYLKNPFYPAIIKKKGLHGGGGKCFLEKEEDLLNFKEDIYTGDARNYLVQEFIKTPSEAFTSFRILVGADGKVVSSGLLYNFENEPSEMFSNACRGGFFVPLGKGEVDFDDRTKSVLSSHAIDPEKPEPPEIIIQQAQKIAQLELSRKRSFYFGVDFLMGKDGRYYWLETNSGPNVHMSVEKIMGKGVPHSHADAYRFFIQELIAA